MTCLSVLAAVRHDGLAGSDRAGDRNLVNTRMLAEHPARLAESLHDLEQTLRQPGLLQDLLQLDRGEGRHVRGLEDHRVSASQRRRGLPTRNLEGIVPGADSGDDTDRLAARVAECGGPEIQVLAGDSRCDTREVFEAIGARGHIDDVGFLDGLAGVAGLELGQLRVARAKQLRRTTQDPPPLGAGARSPFALRSSTQPRQRHQCRRPLTL